MIRCLEHNSLTVNSLRMEARSPATTARARRAGPRDALHSGQPEQIRGRRGRGCRRGGKTGGGAQPRERTYRNWCIGTNSVRLMRRSTPAPQYPVRCDLGVVSMLARDRERRRGRPGSAPRTSCRRSRVPPPRTRSLCPRCPQGPSAPGRSPRAPAATTSRPWRSTPTTSSCRRSSPTTPRQRPTTSPRCSRRSTSCTSATCRCSCRSATPSCARRRSPTPTSRGPPPPARSATPS
jgi:hypothetical protein